MDTPKLRRVILTLQRRTNRIYYPVQDFVAHRPFWPFLLSHGFFHVCVAVGLIFLCRYFYLQTITYQPEYKQIQIELEDSFCGALGHLTIDCGENPAFRENNGVWHNLSIYASFQPTAVSRQYPHRQDSLIFRHSKITIDTYNSDLIYEEGEQGDMIERFGHAVHVDSLSNHHISVSSKSQGNENSDISCSIFGNLFSSDVKNPYYQFYIDLNLRNLPSVLEPPSGNVYLQFSKVDSINMAQTSLHLINVFPQKFTYDPFQGLMFDVKDVIEQGGIYLFAEDIYKKAKIERDTFFYSVMLGAALAFLLDVLVNLVIKWRNLVKKAQSPVRFQYKGFRLRR